MKIRIERKREEREKEFENHKFAPNVFEPVYNAG